MRSKLIKSLLVLAFAVAAWVAAPAISLSPYVPEAVEFEQQLPALRELSVRQAQASGEQHPVRFLSGVIEAPKRFDAVGLVGELRPLEIRVRADGEGWSPWTATEDASPVWAGGADEVQLRSRSFEPQGTLLYVNVSGTATPADRALNAFRGAVNSAFIGVASVTPAQAQLSRPTIQPRSRWDPNRECRPRTSPAYGVVKAATIHHTVSANDYSRSDVPDMIRAICLFHRNGNGWNDIGYNAVLDRFGRVWVGRDGGVGKAVVGAHNQGVNSQTTGLASLGDHRDSGITPAARRAAAEFLAWKFLRHSISNAQGHTVLISDGGEVSRYDSGSEVNVKRIFGHRRTNLTECPGDALFSQLKGLRRKTQRRIDEQTEPVEPEPEDPPDPGGGIPPPEPG